NMTAVIEPFYPKAGNGRRPYKGLLKNDNQLAMLFTLANLFRVDQMIRQRERSQ
ncbi:TPA: hypothetical protein ACWXCN_005305, partial [Klebsiella pneumoniae]